MQGSKLVDALIDFVEHEFDFIGTEANNDASLEDDDDDDDLEGLLVSVSNFLYSVFNSFIVSRNPSLKASCLSS